MSRWLRVALLYIEGLSTAVVGLLAVFVPALVLSSITDVPADDGGLAVARQLGTAWFVIGVVDCVLPFIRDAKTLRWILVPIIIGDFLHVRAVWPLEGAALMHVIPIVVYFLNRGSIVLWPESFIRPKPG